MTDLNGWEYSVKHEDRFSNHVFTKTIGGRAWGWTVEFETRRSTEQPFDVTNTFDEAMAKAAKSLLGIERRLVKKVTQPTKRRLLK